MRVGMRVRELDDCEEQGERQHGCDSVRLTTLRTRRVGGTSAGRREQPHGLRRCGARGGACLVLELLRKVSRLRTV
eukprot:scaffold57750_cov67-Phaeocystis_antarctica.AAC.1